MRAFGIVVFILVTPACHGQDNVPSSEPLDGCYYSETQRVATLGNGEFRSADGSVSGQYTRKQDEIGSFVIFEPAIRLDVSGGRVRLAVNAKLPRNHLVTIRRSGRTSIRMPTDPLGERLIERRRC